MKKIKYFYNTNSLRYEKLETPLRVKLLRIFAFCCGYRDSRHHFIFAFRFVGSPNEKLLSLENERLQDKYHQLNDQVKVTQEQMSELVKRDNEVYRAIFEANPIPDSARARALAQEQEIARVENMRSADLVNSIINSLNNLGHYIKCSEKIL